MPPAPTKEFQIRPEIDTTIIARLRNQITEEAQNLKITPIELLNILIETEEQVGTEEQVETEEQEAKKQVETEERVEREL